MREQIDFSRVSRIAPKDDSWEKVCKRIDALQKIGKERSIPFHVYSVIPFAASLILIALSVLLTAFGQIETNPVAMQEIGSTELTSWYSELGISETEDYEALDESTTISYLLKETK